MRKVFTDLVAKNGFDPDQVRQIASELASRQFAYSKNGNYANQKNTEAPEYAGLSTYLVLFEHFHHQNDDNLPLSARMGETTSHSSLV